MELPRVEITGGGGILEEVCGMRGELYIELMGFMDPSA